MIRIQILDMILTFVITQLFKLSTCEDEAMERGSKMVLWRLNEHLRTEARKWVYKEKENGEKL